MSKCSYCSFVSQCASNEQIGEYFKYLLLHIKRESETFKNRQISSIYFGGGTPSFVDETHIQDVMQTIRQNYNVSKDAEITIECNPCTTTLSKLTAYKNAGINRISFGVQSLHDKCLQAIGRKHTAKQALNAINLAKSVGFVNISADMLIGIPHQTKNMFLEDIKTLINGGVTHISAYMLMLEQGTKLYEQVLINHSLTVADDDQCVNMYNDAYSMLEQNGFKRYEISNFCKVGYECKHNVNYWDMGDYLGFGVSAHSCVNGFRVAGINSFDKYYNFVNKNYVKSNKIVSMTKGDSPTNNILIEEHLMLGLRQTKGVLIEALNKLGYDILNDKKTTIDMLVKNNFIAVDDKYIKVTPESFGVTNQIILELLP